MVAAVGERAARGTAYFAPCPLEVELAELLAERIPSLERLRFCSSGTEAVLGALRAARAFTGRPLIAKFEGAYHGIDDPALISYLPPLGPELGPAERPLPVAASAGLAPGTAESVLVLPFNDGEACEALIREHADRLAAVIVDPLSTAAGMTLPAPGFLETLRAVTSELEIVLIFDEVVSFRAGRGGMQGVHGIRPDLTCLAKVVAGGTPGGAFGGRADIMALYDPSGGSPAIPQSGTYNGNPIVTAAGLATLRTMTDAAYQEIHDRTARLGEGLRQVFAGAGRAGVRGHGRVAVPALLPAGGAAQLPRGGAGRRRPPALAVLLADEPRHRDAARRQRVAADDRPPRRPAGGGSGERPAPPAAMSIARTRFGVVDGRPVERYLMRNSRGTSAAVLTLGANLHSVRTRGRDGFDEITLAWDDVAGYLAAGGPYFGAIAGRVANRIAGGAFTLDGTHYRLACNHGGVHLHGGEVGFDRRIWHAAIHEGSGEDRVALRYVSPDARKVTPAR